MTTKTRTNVSVDACLMQEARSLGLNLSSLLEERLRDEVAARRRAVWRAENRGAIEDANEFVKKHGLWSDGLLQF